MTPAEQAREIVMDAPKFDNAVGDLLPHGMREDLIQRIAAALAAQAGHPWDQHLADQVNALMEAEAAQTRALREALERIASGDVSPHPALPPTLGDARAIARAALTGACNG